MRIDDSSRTTREFVGYSFSDWRKALAKTFVPLFVVAGAAALIAGKPEFLLLALAVGVGFELLALIAILLDRAGLPGGLTVGLLAFLPWSLIGLILFRKDIDLGKLTRPKEAETPNQRQS